MVRSNRRRYFIVSLGTTAAVTALALLMGLTGCSDTQATNKPNYVFKDNAPRAGIVAKINGEEITEEVLIGDDKMDFIDLKKKEYDLKMDRLNRLLIEKLVGAEAKKANLSLEEFIDKKVISGKVKVSTAEFDKFVTQRRIPKDQINDKMKEQVMQYLEGMKRQELLQGYVAKLTKSNPVEVYFSKPKLTMDVDFGNGPSFGPDSAPVTIVEFSDFQCPFCSRGAESVTQIKKKYGNKVRVAFRHFPLPMHPEARPASEASMCVHEQNKDKFWPYHDLLFKNQNKLDNESLEKYAKDVGVNMEKFKECFGSKRYAQQVQDDLSYGEKLGVRSTPTFFINGQLVAGALPIESFSEIIDEELAARK